MLVEKDVLAVLDQSRTDGNALFLVGGQLDRKLYERTNKVLEAAGGKWNRKAKAHIFEGPAMDAIEQVLLTGEITLPQDFGCFFTPSEVAERVIDLADIRPGMQVLEPSAGQGALARAALDAGADVMAYELLDANIKALVDAIRTHPRQGLSMVVQGDFLAVNPSPLYDRVIMNPPFARQDDIRHVMHAHKFLKSGGRLVSVMSNGVTFRKTALTDRFNDLLSACGGEIEPLPVGAFKASGTMVNTVIATIPAGVSVKGTGEQ